jgi:hypothetical protein
MLSGRIHKTKRKIRFLFNRLRTFLTFKRHEGRLYATIPERFRKPVSYLKYIFTAIGLLSALYVFSSVLIGFLFGLGIFALTSFLERIAFRHSYLFVHPLPNFDLDNEKWVGCGFGYAVPPSSSEQIPLVSMMVTDLEYAKKLQSLFLAWTGGNRADKEKNIQVTVVITKPDEYIFLFYPNPKRPIAQKFFQSAKDKLRQKSLTDEIGEHHMTLVLGKRCHLGPNSYFLEFRRRFKNGTPVMFEFVLPPFDDPRPTPDVPSLLLFDFSIKDKRELTRKDFVYEVVDGYKMGGKWQGPKELEPR